MSEQNDNEFARRLRIARITSEMTQEELAARINTTKQNISQYERGIRRPKIETIEKIAAALEIEPRELYPATYVDIGPLNIAAHKALASLDSDGNETKQNDTLSKLVRSFKKLNAAGQEKAASYTADLTKIPEYRKDK